jgi:hypothetical protein
MKKQENKKIEREDSQQGTKSKELPHSIAEGKSFSDGMGQTPVDSQSADSTSQGCGKNLGYKCSETGVIRYCGDEVFAGMDIGLRTILCKTCSKTINNASLGEEDGK